MGDNKGMVLITALAVMVILLTLGAGHLFISRTQIDISLNQAKALKAFYISQAGIEKALSQLIADSSWRAGLVENFGDGNYTVTVTDIAGGKVRVRSVASLGSAARTIVTEVQLIVVNKVVRIDGKIDVNNSTGTVTGDITYGSGQSYDLGSLTASGTITEAASGDTIPSITLRSYSLTADHTNNGNFTFSSAGSPYSGIYYINGNATINDNVVINGTVWATGEIKINNVNNSITISPSGSNPALLSEDKITLNNIQSTSANRTNINGPLYAQNTVDINNVNWTNLKDLISVNSEVKINNVEDSTVTGLVYAKNEINLNNTQDTSITGMVYSKTDDIKLNNLTDCSFTGSLVCSKDLDGNNLTNVTIPYSNSSLPSSSYTVSEAEGISVTSWKGHP